MLILLRIHLCKQAESSVQAIEYKEQGTQSVILSRAYACLSPEKVKRQFMSISHLSFQVRSSKSSFNCADGPVQIQHQQQPYFDQLRTVCSRQTGLPLWLTHHPLYPHVQSICWLTFSSIHSNPIVVPRSKANLPWPFPLKSQYLIFASWRHVLNFTALEIK